MDLVKCPFCDKEIESDSFFCDQCGKELMVCPVGHGFKKNKMCNECGKPLATAKSKQAVSPAHLEKSQVMEAPVEKEKAPQASESTIRQVVQPKVPQFLVSKELNASLPLQDGAVIGRKTGNYLHIFSTQGYVSGTHARLHRKKSGEWEIVDLDSTNGTFLNGVQLIPNQSAPFSLGDTIAFYDLKFIVE